MNKASYFVRVDTYWAWAPDYFVGPFASRDAAQAAIDEALSASGGLAQMAYNLSPDVWSGVRIHGILSRTAARRSGMRDDDQISRIPLNADDLARQIEEIF